MNDTIHAQRVWKGRGGAERRATWKVIAQLHQLGLQAPYFSLTYEEADSRGEVYSCGASHDRCIELAPECAPFARWHLTSPKGPMHYRANGLYWAGFTDHVDKATGAKSIRPSPWAAAGTPASPGSQKPPHWPHFASTVVLGGVVGDPALDSGELQRMTGAELADWLDARLERLRAAFAHAMHTCFEDQPAGVLAAFEYDEDAARAGVTR